MDKKEVRFSFELKNENTANKIIALSVASLLSVAQIALAGEPADALLGDGVILADAINGDVTCTASDPKFTVDHFKNFLDRHTLHVKRIALQTASEEQVEQRIDVTPVWPFGNMSSNAILFREYFSEFQFSAKKYTLELQEQGEDFVMNNLTLVTMPVVAGATVLITLYGEVIE